MSGDEVLFTEIAVVAGVEDDETGIGLDPFDLFENDSAAEVGDGVFAQLLRRIDGTVPRRVETEFLGLADCGLTAGRRASGAFAEEVSDLFGGLFR